MAVAIVRNDSVLLMKGCGTGRLMRKHGIDDRDANTHLYRTMLEFWKRSLQP